MKEKPISFLRGAGRAHLIYHSLVLASIITVFMTTIWTSLLSFQRMPTHDLGQLPSFFIFISVSIFGIASIVFIISFFSAIFGLWLKCGSNHSYFYRIYGLDTEDCQAIRKHLKELNFVSNRPDLLIRDNLIADFLRDDTTWIFMLRPRYWSPNLKVNKQLQKVAWSIQEIV